MVPLINMLTSLLSKHNLQAYILPTSDNHLSEYTAASDKRLEFLTGFTGSAGIAVFMPHSSVLYTDSRYFIQAQSELKNGFTLMRMGEDEDVAAYLKGKGVRRVGADLRLFSYRYVRRLRKELEGVELVGVDDFVDAVWVDKPRRVFNRIYSLEEEDLRRYRMGEGGRDGDVRGGDGTEGDKVKGDTGNDKGNDTGSDTGSDTNTDTHTDTHTDTSTHTTPLHTAPPSTPPSTPHTNTLIPGVSYKDKLKSIQSNLTNTLLLTDLNSIAYLFNLRGSDIPYNTVFYAYAVITKEQAVLYVNGEVPPLDSVILRKYDEFDLKGVEGEKVSVSELSNAYVVEGLSERAVVEDDCVGKMKSVKNGAEVEGFRMAHLYDSVALCALFEWLEEICGRECECEGVRDCGDEGGSECDAGDSKGGAGDRDATPTPGTSTPLPCTHTHSHPHPPHPHSHTPLPCTRVTERDVAAKLESLKKKLPGYIGPSFATIAGYASNAAIVHHSASNTPLGTSSLLLLDSGSHYLFGTTDITRTLHLGTPTAQQKKDYTLVLKGAIAARKMVFSKSMPASSLDTVARMYLWQEHLDFGHSTGHGVGHVLGVHEAPPSVSHNSSAPLKENQVFSIEPGLYRENEYGIRIEDLVRVQGVGDGFYGLEDLGMTPYQMKMVDVGMLDDGEMGFLDAYNFRIRREMERYVGEGRRFLMENTEEIRR